MRLLDRVRPAAHTESRDSFGFSDWLSLYSGGLASLGIQQTIQGQKTEELPNSFTGYVQQGYQGNGVVFACELARLMVFSEARFQFQRLRKGRPSELFSLPSLELLARPWVGGTTGDLLSRMILDADFAGNAYLTVDDGELLRLRPDWVSIVLESRVRGNGVVGVRRVGYVYREGGQHGDPDRDVVLLAGEVAHFAPLPDPLAAYRGMSWLTPVVREIAGDQAMNRHKLKFFENAATPNLVVKLDAAISPAKFDEFLQRMDATHKGVEDAYKTLYLGGGADVTVVGSSFEQMSFKTVQGHGETRVAAAAGVPPVIVGLSEGLQAATYSNYAQARRRYADGTVRPLWRNAASSLEVLVPPPAAARLWYDDRDIPFLREDAKDAADIQRIDTASIRTLIDGGFKPDSVVAAVKAQDLTLLVHSGRVSVQLLDPEADAGGGDAEADTNRIDPADVNSLGMLVRSGFEAEDSAAKLGLPAIAHTGLLPVTVQSPDALEVEPPADDEPAPEAPDDAA